MKFPTKKNEGMESEIIADNHSSGVIEAPPASNNSSAANGGWAYAVKKKLHAIFSKVKKKLHAIFSKVIETLFDQKLIIKPIREIQEKKLLHNQALDLLKFLCEEAMKPCNYFEADRNFWLPLNKQHRWEFMKSLKRFCGCTLMQFILKTIRSNQFSSRLLCSAKKKCSISYTNMKESRTMVLSKGDDSNNNALHLAGYVPHPEQLYHRAGAALQMQRELQWFKEVERLVLPKNREERNNKEKTPAQVFSDEHKGLVKEGEKWMKGAASSGTIVATLIATVVFAAAIQVPGGNFGIFNALALFSSIASVVLFLSILTSRYAEEDFLFTLPNRLIIGLICMFLSILFMMMAFGATLYLVFGENKGWILIPAGALDCIPVTLFCALQFALLKDMIKSTYGFRYFFKAK